MGRAEAVCVPAEGSTAFTFLTSDHNFAVKKLEHPASPTLKAGINEHGRTHGDDFPLSPAGAYWMLVEKQTQCWNPGVEGRGR